MSSFALKLIYAKKSFGGLFSEALAKENVGISKIKEPIKVFYFPHLYLLATQPPSPLKHNSRT